MQRSSLFMLLGALVLGLVAVLIARTFLLRDPADSTAAPGQPMVTVVVAAKPLAFGDKITPEVLKEAQWPSTGGLPAGTFSSVRDAVQDGSKVATRAIDANELVTAKALSGAGGRLSSSGLIKDNMRAIAIPVGEQQGVGGFVAPGDRVDVMVTRNGEPAEARTAMLVQAVRVLAVGQDANMSKEEPTLVRTVTLEVSPEQAQLLTLAQAVGTLTVMLRGATDEARIVPDVTTVAAMRGLIAPVAAPAAAAPAARAAPQPSMPRRPAGPEIAVVRGTETSSYRMATGS